MLDKLYRLSMFAAGILLLLMVVLTAVKRQQITELKELVMEIDPNAFVIVQEVHQVLGDGFSRYHRNAL